MTKLMSKSMFNDNYTNNSKLMQNFHHSIYVSCSNLRRQVTLGSSRVEKITSKPTGNEETGDILDLTLRNYKVAARAGKNSQFSNNIEI